MATMSIVAAANRISITDDSLAVFAIEPQGPDVIDIPRVNVVFSNTVMTQYWIERGLPKLIAIFDGTVRNKELIRSILINR